MKKLAVQPLAENGMDAEHMRVATKMLLLADYLIEGIFRG